MKPVFLALGTNLGDREANLRRAVSALHGPDLSVLRVSPVYETAPVGFAEQSWFLNLVLEAQTSLLPLRLLTRCKKIERLLGRRRTLKNGPRTIDIDVLLYGNTAVRTPRLEIPHPRYRERRFVLQPLYDLAPGLLDPVTHDSVRDLLARTAGQILRPANIVIPVPQAAGSFSEP